MLSRFWVYCRSLVSAVVFLLVLVTPAHADRVLIVGDSISAGFGIPLQAGWAALFEKQLQQQVPSALVVNASISGDTTSGGRSRLAHLLAQHEPSLVIIELGGNDGLRGTPLTVIRQNLITMIEQAQARGATVLLAGMQIPPNYGARYSDGFAQLFIELAEQYRTLLVPFILEGIGGVDGMMQADGIHPTAAAQSLMLDHVWQAIQPWLATQP